MKSEKVTYDAEAIGWSYGDACGAAHALDLVGERWALLVMRELMFGPKRFSDLRTNLPGLSANVLTQRLTKLEKLGIVERVTLPPPAGRAYRLTAWGLEARPIFMVLGRWAARSPLHDKTLPLSAASIMLSFETMLVPERAAWLDLSIGITVGAEDFRLRVADRALTIVRGDEGSVAATLSVGAAPVLAGWVYGGVPLEGLEADGAAQVSGDRGALATFRGLFALPPLLGLES